MTTEKEIKRLLLGEIAKSLKVKKTFDAIGEDHSKNNEPVRLEDFSFSFNLPFNLGSYGCSSNKDHTQETFHATTRIRTANPAQATIDLVNSKRADR